MDINNIDSEKELLSRFAGGDETAFRTLYAKFQGKIFAFALKHTKSSLVAKEVLQTVFIKLWDKRSQVKAENNFEGYIIRITHNHILNLLRDTARDKQKLQRAYQLMQEMRDNPETDLITKELAQTYRQAIESLPQQKKIIYRLREEQALSYAAIAEQLHISPLTVKKHMAEASRMIRAYIMQHGELGTILVALELYHRLT